VYDPNAAPPVPQSPPPARYGYLVGRLRSRQITMEEATELFALQQALIAQANSMASAPAPPPPDTLDTTPPPPPAGVPSGLPTSLFSDENIALGLLAMGAGAGMLAAVMKRAQEGPKPRA
jgi:hypothetical protein